MPAAHKGFISYCVAIFRQICYNIRIGEDYETEYWLELFVKSDILNREKAVELYNQCGTICRILIASINTAKENTK